MARPPQYQQSAACRSRPASRYLLAQREAVARAARGSAAGGGPPAAAPAARLCDRLAGLLNPGQHAASKGKRGDAGPPTHPAIRLTRRR